MRRGARKRDVAGLIRLSALQKRMHSGHLLLRGEQSAVDAVYGQMALGGFSPGEPRTLTPFRAGETVVSPWIRMVAVTLSGVALLLAMHGVHVNAVREALAVEPAAAVAWRGASLITYALARDAHPGTLPSSRVLKLRIRPHT